MSEMKDVEVTILRTETLKKIKEYLETKPYTEVAELIAILIFDSQTIKPEMLQPAKELEKEV